MTRGGRICLFSSLHRSRSAACLLRRRWTRTSSTTPTWSTARQSQCFTPVILSTTSSKCHLSPTRGRRRRIWLANGWPTLRAHCRTVSWLTMMPRAASNSSTMRSPSGKRKYNHTAWPMISAGNRYPASRARVDVLILPDYSPRSVRASAARPAKLTVPDDPDSPFFAEALLRAVWDPGGNPRLAAIERVVLVHRLREVLALVGFTRFEAAGTDEKGELDLEGITAAALSPEPEWFPAVENRGEGIFVVLSAEVIAQWRNREGVRQRERQLLRGKLAWDAEHSSANRHWLGVPYVLLHSLSHLLLTRIALDCGYPAAALRERIYALPEAGMYGLLIHTGTSDSEGTLGGLVETGRRIGEHPRGPRGCPSVLERSGL